MDQARGVGIADGGLEVFAFLVENVLHFLAQNILLGTNLRAETKQRAPEDKAIFGLHIALKTVAEIAVIPQALERRNGR